MARNDVRPRRPARSIGRGPRENGRGPRQIEEGSGRARVSSPVVSIGRLVRLRRATDKRYRAGGAASADVGGSDPPFFGRLLAVALFLARPAFAICRCSSANRFLPGVWRSAAAAGFCPGAARFFGSRARDSLFSRLAVVRVFPAREPAESGERRERVHSLCRFLPARLSGIQAQGNSCKRRAHRALGAAIDCGPTRRGGFLAPRFFPPAVPRSPAGICVRVRAFFPPRAANWNAYKSVQRQGRGGKKRETPVFQRDSEHGSYLMNARWHVNIERGSGARGAVTFCAPRRRIDG